MDCKYCIDELNFKVKIYDIQKKCKYHKEKSALYLPSSIAPKGMCRQLFYISYPKCLAVLYNGKPLKGWLRRKGMERAFASCPHPDGIKVEISSREALPAPLRMLKELSEEFLKIVYRPLDAHFRRVIIKVIKTAPSCPKNYKKGDIFKFNVSNKEELCPAGFAAIYPYVRFLNSPEGNSIKVHCPDPTGVIYELASK